MRNDRGNIWIGLFTGLVLPLAGYALIWLILQSLEPLGLVSSEGFAPNFRERTAAVLAICLNLIPFNRWQQQRKMQSVRGVAVMTVLYALGWMIFFGRQIL